MTAAAASRFTMRARLVAIAALSCLCLAAAPAAEARVPQGWLGAMMDGPMATPATPRFNPDRETKLMVSSGVEGVRTVFYWYNEQPYSTPTFVKPSQRPFFRTVGGVATNYSESDVVVARAAKYKLPVLPVVFGAPAWLRKRNINGSPPRDPNAYAVYLTGLVQRYGPNGSFWRENPKLPKVPIRKWQLWNEQDFIQNWREPSWQKGYAKLLKAAYPAIKKADPGAKVILGGMANRGYDALRTLYRVKGVKRYFDAVALHPYTSTPAGVIELVRRGRSVMRKAGDSRKQVFLTEFGWPSSNRKRYGFETTQKGQASRLKEALPLLAKNRRKLKIGGVYYYTWLRQQEPKRSNDSFDYAGLRKFSKGKVIPKPVFNVFRRGALKLEGCKRKGGAPNVCARRR